MKKPFSPDRRPNAFDVELDRQNSARGAMGRAAIRATVEMQTTPTLTSEPSNAIGQIASTTPPTSDRPPYDYETEYDSPKTDSVA